MLPKKNMFSLSRRKQTRCGQHWIVFCLKPTTCSFPRYRRPIAKELFKKLTTVSSFFTSSTALSSFSFARFSESSTVISTCSSSLRCSQFGFPRFCSSWKITHVSRPVNGNRINVGLVRDFIGRQRDSWSVSIR